MPPPFNLVGYIYKLFASLRHFELRRVAEADPQLSQRRRGSSLIVCLATHGWNAVLSIAAPDTHTQMDYAPINEGADTEQASTRERDLLLEYLKELRERRQKTASSEVTIQVPPLLRHQTVAAVSVLHAGGRHLTPRPSTRTTQLVPRRQIVPLPARASG